ncbi:MAG: hypothetical protein AAFU49_11935 [Pseudomonadota bacterium]
MRSKAGASRLVDAADMVRRQRDAILERDGRTARFVRNRLTEGWYPWQISGRLKSGAECSLCAVTLEMIYAIVYRAHQRVEELCRYLARRHKRRRPLCARPSCDTIKGRVSIHERPGTVVGRSKQGHRGVARAPLKLLPL